MKVKFTSRDEDSSGPLDWTGDFLKSSVSAVPELFGGESFDGVDAFRARNPTAGFVSQLAGGIVPYIGWESVVMKIPAMAKAVNAASVGIKSPALARGTREIVKLAPFELGRMGIASTIGGEDPFEQAFQSSIALGLTGGIGAAIGGIAGSGKVLSSLEGLADPGKPVQLQLRDLIRADKDHLSGAIPLDDVKLNGVRQAISTLRARVRETDYQRVIGTRDGVSKTGKPIKVPVKSKFILRGFDDPSTAWAAGTVEKAFNSGKKITDDNVPGWEDVFAKNGIQASTFESFAESPRIAVGKGLKKLNGILGGKGGVFREADEGLFVIVKPLKFPDKVLADGSKKSVEKTLVFKTDSPDEFFPAQANWTKRQDLANRWGEQVMQKIAPGQSTLLAMGHATMGGLSQFKGTTQVKNAALKGISDTMEKLVTPFAFQLRDSVLGRAGMVAMQGIFDAAETAAKTFTYGARGVDPTKSPLWQLFKGSAQTTGDNIYDALVKAEVNGTFPGINKVLLNEIDRTGVNEMFTKGELSAPEYAALLLMQKGEQFAAKEIYPLQRVTGQFLYKDRDGHWGVPRNRDGDFRIAVNDEKGRTIYMGYGDSGGEVQALAKKVIADSGKKWSSSEPFLQNKRLETSLMREYGGPSGKTGDAALAKKLWNDELRRVKGSRNFSPRENVAGFKTEWNAADLAKAYGNHMEAKFKHAASMATREMLKDYGDKITVISGKHAWDILTRRLDDFEGIPGKIAAAQNEFSDKILGPILGSGSATKITSAMNKWFMHMTLGAGNMAYPVTNMLNFVNISMPHLAMIEKAAPARLAGMYDTVVVQARNGMRAVSVLSASKLGARSWTQMASKEPEWVAALNRAMVEGKIAPRFAEEFAGEGSTRWANIQWQNPKDWARVIANTSLFGMEFGERLSRGNSFALGYLFFKEFMGLAGDDLYRAASKFVDNTMYRYGASDRATIFAGPVGSTFGLFKNWMLNYTFWMMEAAGMAAKNPTRLAAWKPLMWQLAGTSVVGGIGAWPLMTIADNFSRMASDKNVMQNIYENVGNDSTSDAIYYGLTGRLGLSLASQTDMPFSAPLRDAEFMMMPAMWHRMTQASKALGDSVDWFSATGQFNPGTSDKLRLQWAQALGPKTLYRALQVQEEGILRSANSGAPLVKELGTLERIGWALSMPSLDVQKTFDISTELHSNLEKKKRTVEMLGQQYKEAMVKGDFKEQADIFKRAMKMGIGADSVAASGKARYARENQDMIESQFSPEMQSVQRDVLNSMNRDE